MNYPGSVAEPESLYTIFLHILQRSMDRSDGLRPMEEVEEKLNQMSNTEFLDYLSMALYEMKNIKS